MYILYLQFKYWLSLFYLNLCLLSQLHLSPSISIFLHLYSEIQDCIYCGCTIKAEAKVRSNSAHRWSLPIIADNTSYHRSTPTNTSHHQSTPTNTGHHQHHWCNSDLRSGTILTQVHTQNTQLEILPTITCQLRNGLQSQKLLTIRAACHLCEDCMLW